MLGELFDPKQEFSIERHCRPHWSQAGAVVFLTFRTQDSVPREVVLGWENEKRDWLRRLGINDDLPMTAAIAELSGVEKTRFLKHFNRCREAFLDSCHGRCPMKRPEVAAIVAGSLLHFDGERYRMG